MILLLILIIAAIVLFQYLYNNNLFMGGEDGGDRPLPEFKTQSKFELHIQTLMEKITGKKFPTAYPPWLVYQRRQLELDGYNEQLRIAFEAQGPMHSRFDPRFDPTYAKYYRRLENDCAKRKICKRKGVALIVIHYDIPKHLLELYLQSRLYDIYHKRGKDSPFGKKPDNYMLKHDIDIYRNHVFEKELGLDTTLCRQL